MGKKTVVTAKEAETQTKEWINGKKSNRKMKVVNTQGRYYTPKKEGDFIEGEFVEMIRKEGTKHGIVELINGKKTKVSYQGSISDVETGEITIMPSTKVLNDFFETLEAGTFIRVTYRGKKLKNGKKKGDDNSEYHDYLLESEETEPTKSKKK